jgi:hypothetical protein
MLHFLPYLYELTPLYLAQAAFTIWMLVDAGRRGVDAYWFWIILFFQPIGAWAYFFLYKVKDFGGGTGWLANLFKRRTPLSELRYRVERSPTPAHWLELGDRLVETGAYAEAVPHLEAVLAREPEHCRCLFLLAQAHRGMDQPALAVPLLQRLLARQPGWGDYKAWHALIEVLRKSGNTAEAVSRCRELARVAPTLEHKCLLAQQLLETEEKAEAGKVLTLALEEYRYATGLGRRRDRRWVGKARQLLRTTEDSR